MATKPELIYFPPSPFSQRARWALDAAGADYKLSNYAFSTTYLGELPLRWRLGRLSGTITAPIMLLPRQDGGGNEVIMDSTDIARWADEHSSSRLEQLFPKQHVAEVDRWLKASNNLLSLFRREMIGAGLVNPRIRDALLPPGLTGLSGMLARHMMRRTFATIAAKYKEEDAGAQMDQATADLEAARQLLASNPNKLLLPSSNSSSSDASTTPATITYAEISLATALNKMAELHTKLQPQPAAAAAAAAEEGPQTMADCVPDLKKLLLEFSDLVDWAAETTKQHWPAGAGVQLLS